MRPQVVSLKKQAGLTLIEMAIVIVLAAVVILAGMKIVPSIQFSLSASKLTQDVNEIRTAALNWKGSRPNFVGVGMDKLCGSGRVLLPQSICGVSGTPGTASAPWGGDYEIAVDPSDASVMIISIDKLPNQRVLELGDTLAAMTRDRCVDVEACNSATVAGKSASPGYTASLDLKF
ncbi:type II secretion system protein [Vibrio parahaemolyticus]|nr:type II secretion system protein [Vibrio parahaemolyticus]